MFEKREKMHSNLCTMTARNRIEQIYPVDFHSKCVQNITMFFFHHSLSFVFCLSFTNPRYFVHLYVQCRTCTTPIIFQVVHGTGYIFSSQFPPLIFCFFYIFFFFSDQRLPMQSNVRIVLFCS